MRRLNGMNNKNAAIIIVAVSLADLGAPAVYSVQQKPKIIP
jgi:hypothetical protein